jgi:hypothetical protein
VLIAEQWWERVDLMLTFRRLVRKNYPVLNVLSSETAVVPD